MEDMILLYKDYQNLGRLGSNILKFRYDRTARKKHPIGHLKSSSIGLNMVTVLTVHIKNKINI